MENTKASQSNLFMHGITSDFRALLDRERIHVIGHDWNQNSMKKIEKLWHENQILIPSIH